jgi:hypothetical protein
VAGIFGLKGVKGPFHTHKGVDEVMTIVCVKVVSIAYSKNNRGLPLDGPGGLPASADKVK